MGEIRDGEWLVRCDSCGREVVIFGDLPEDGDFSVICVDCWEEGVRPPLPVWVGLPL